MQVIFNCCHGMFDPQNGRWICSSQVSDPGCGVDEEIIGDESPAYKPQIQGVRAQDGEPIVTASRAHPPRPIGGPGGATDEKENAKLRLQRLIRDFAHDAVGHGLEVEACSAELMGIAPDGVLQAVLLRMDRRLSRLEIWPVSSSDTGGTAATMALPLQQVESLVKGTRQPPADSEELDPEREACTLTVVQRGKAGQDLRLTFLNPFTRDRAYTCLRIFQMSVDQSLEREGSQANEPDLQSMENGLESGVPGA